MADKKSGSLGGLQFTPTSKMPRFVQYGELARLVREQQARLGATGAVPDFGPGYFGENPATASRRAGEQMDAFRTADMADRQQKIGETSGVGSLLSLADLATGGARNFIGGELAGKALEVSSALGFNPIDSAVKMISDNPLAALGAGALVGGKKLRSAGRVVADDLNHTLADLSKPAVKTGVRDAFAPQSIMPASPSKAGLNQRLIDEFNATNPTPLEPSIVSSLKSAAGNKTKPVPITQSGMEKAYDKRAELRAEPDAHLKPFTEWSDAEFQEFGAKHGVDMTVNPLVRVTDPGTGREWDIPGGLDVPLSYADQFQLKAQGINPKELSKEFHSRLQKRMVEAVTPSEEQLKDPIELFNRTMFGLTSAGAPLTQQELLTARLRARSKQDLQEIADYTEGKNYDKGGRYAIDTQIGVDKGVNAGSGGGMGMRGSASLAGVSELAAGVLKNPGFYRKQASESWPQFTERLVNATKGLGMKTGGFGGVMQAPGEATVAPMDLHMARNFLPVVLEHPVLGDKFRKSAVQAWNKQEKNASDLVGSYDELIGKEKGQKFAHDQIIKQVNQTKSVVTMKKGEPNPAVPEHLRNIPGDPKKVQMYGANYNAMLGENARLAAENGLGVFAEQWRLWDGLRKRVEPHEVMRPGLHNLPPLSASELMRSHEAHKAAGYAGKGSVRPTDWKRLFYYSAPPVTGGLLGQYGGDEDQEQPRRK